MGKALQIRVSAVTWNEDLLEKLWPQLSELAFTVPNSHTKRGVIEMVQCLSDGLHYTKWPDERKDKLGPNISKAIDIVNKLESALADWDPREANRLSDQLEDVLNDLERFYI